MTREQIISKIQSMLRLQEKTDFEGEASAAAKMIEKLCKQYGITVQEASEPIAKDEAFSAFKRKDGAYAILLNAVANFYNAKLYLKTNRYEGVKTYQIIGTEAQQIQTKLYFDFLYESMIKECELAYKAEKVIADIQGKPMQRSFRTNFKKAFANQVSVRLIALKDEQENNDADAAAVKKKLSQMRLTKGSAISGPQGQGAQSGLTSGSNVSLNRQTAGRKQMALAGAS
jgi:hypothetical protein